MQVNFFAIGNEPDWYIPHRILFNYPYHNSFEAFHWLRVLGKAYWLTNNPAYAEHAKKWLKFFWLNSIPDNFQSDFWKDINFFGMWALNLFAVLILFSDVWKLSKICQKTPRANISTRSLVLTPDGICRRRKSFNLAGS